MTARPTTSVPSDSRTTRWPASSRRPVAAHGLVSAAPNFSACTTARSSQVCAGNAGWKSEIVLDPRAVPRLPADRNGLQPQRRQALGGAVHRRRETCWAATDHDEVEASAREVLDGEPEIFGQLAGCRSSKHRSGDDDNRELARMHAELE